jgi:hypothetical protein
MSQLTKSSQKIQTSKGLSDINATAETCALYAHLQNIKHAVKSQFPFLIFLAGFSG